MRFPEENGQARVRLLDPYDPLVIEDRRYLSQAQQAAAIRRWVAKHTQTPFDLASGPLLRVCLLRFTETDQVLLFNLHSIIADGWSIRVLLRELSVLYGAYRDGRAAPMTPFAI